MANVKQLNMLSAKARQAGLSFDRDEAKDLENGEVTALVESFNNAIVKNGELPFGLEAEELQAAKEKLAKQKPKEKAEVLKTPAVLNGQRFGMCYKLVSDKIDKGWKGQNPNDFIERVVAEYKLSEKAEEAVLASSSSSFADPDYCNIIGRTKAGETSRGK